MKTRRSNPAFLNGVPELLVLHLLARKPRYGYELVQAIKAGTDHVFEFGEGCIYPILHRLESEGLLLPSKETVSGRTRVVYQVTTAGRQQLAESVTTWERVVEAVCRVLQGGAHGQPRLA
jgi:PadR family transcriptional regulator PadR